MTEDKSNKADNLENKNTDILEEAMQKDLVLSCSTKDSDSTESAKKCNSDNIVPSICRKSVFTSDSVSSLKITVSNQDEQQELPSSSNDTSNGDEVVQTDDVQTLKKQVRTVSLTGCDGSDKRNVPRKTGGQRSSPGHHSAYTHNYSHVNNNSRLPSGYHTYGPGQRGMHQRIPPASHYGGVLGHNDSGRYQMNRRGTSEYGGYRSSNTGHHENGYGSSYGGSMLRRGGSSVSSSRFYPNSKREKADVTRTLKKLVTTESEFDEDGSCSLSQSPDTTRYAQSSLNGSRPRSAGAFSKKYEDDTWRDHGYSERFTNLLYELGWTRSVLYHRNISLNIFQMLDCVVVGQDSNTLMYSIILPMIDKLSNDVQYLRHSPSMAIVCPNPERVRRLFCMLRPFVSRPCVNLTVWHSLHKPPTMDPIKAEIVIGTPDSFTFLNEAVDVRRCLRRHYYATRYLFIDSVDKFLDGDELKLNSVLTDHFFSGGGVKEKKCIVVHTEDPGALSLESVVPKLLGKAQKTTHVFDVRKKPKKTETGGDESARKPRQVIPLPVHNHVDKSAIEVLNEECQHFWPDDSDEEKNGF